MKVKKGDKKLLKYEQKLSDIEKQINTLHDNYEKINNNIEGLYDSINDITSTKQIQVKKYNTRHKKIKYNFGDENIDSTDDEDEDPDYTDGSDGSDGSDGTDDSHYDTNDTDGSYGSHGSHGTDKQLLLVSKYIDAKIDAHTNATTKLDKKEKKKVKEQSIIFYNNLIKTQSQFKLNQIYEHINYFITTSPEQKLHILKTFDNIINLSDNKIPRLFKIINSTLDTYYKKLALNKIELLDKMKPGDNEYFKLSNWLDTFLTIPFNIYKTPKYMEINTLSIPSKYLKDAQLHLDKVIYGQQKTKTHIIEILAKMITNPKTIGSVFAIHGEAGTGKTTLIKDGLSEVFGLPFIFISLGGAQDRTFLSGSNYVYEGSACGKIVQSLKQSQCMNPIFYFDELDKVSSTDKGNEIINMLIHLTDYTQNNNFMDEYLDGISIDLSRATFIFSFNEKSKISPILLDRMEIIKFQSYSLNEKLHIAQSFLLPNIIKNIFGEDNKNITISDEKMKSIINIPQLKNKNKNNNSKYSKCKKHNTINNTIHNKLIQKNKYGGVRYIKKRLEKIVSKINVDFIMNTK